MQEEVNEKTVSLCITGGKVTVRLLKQATLTAYQTEHDFKLAPRLKGS